MRYIAAPERAQPDQRDVPRIEFVGPGRPTVDGRDDDFDKSVRDPEPDTVDDD